MCEDKKYIIPADTINHIKGFCFSLASNSEDRSFELDHIEQVEKYIMELSKLRGLDADISLLIAVLHDMGRIKCGIYGRGHAEAGAGVAKEILKDHCISKKVSRVICEAIKNHNKKGKIHDKYSELIKDADSLSRFHESRGIHIKTYEYIRSSAAYDKGCRITGNPDADPVKILKAQFNILIDQIHGFLKPGNDQKQIHEIRVQLRMIRSLIWYYKISFEGDSKTDIKVIDSQLRKLFQKFGLARAYHVFRKQLRKNVKFSSISRQLAELRDKNIRKLKKEIEKIGVRLIEILEDRVIHLFDQYKDNEKNELRLNTLFKDVLDSTKIKKTESLHKLRILSKKLIYLNDMQIIEFSYTKFHDLLKLIHSKAGTINDIEQNTDLLNTIKTKKDKKISDIAKSDIETWMEKKKPSLIRETRMVLFEIRLRCKQ